MQRTTDTKENEVRGFLFVIPTAIIFFLGYFSAKWNDREIRSERKDLLELVSKIREISWDSRDIDPNLSQIITSEITEFERDRKELP